MAIAKATFEELVAQDAATIEAAEMELLRRKTQNELRQTYLRAQEKVLELEGRVATCFRNVREIGLNVQDVLTLTAQLRTTKEAASDTQQLWNDLFPGEAI